MNELQRQTYLSALGIDTYMPRWQLPYAPVANACELPAAFVNALPQEIHTINESGFTQPQSIHVVKAVNVEPSSAIPLISDMLETKKSVNAQAVPVSAADILASLNVKPITVEPFSLSIWRPLEGVMIIDARNTRLALPTDLLLNNILRSTFSNQALKPQEEVLRWPMIENSFTKRTLNDARIELQTWLSVQHEIRPIRRLWLMGANAAMYLLPDSIQYTDSVFEVQSLAELSVSALILPSLNELLQKPATKQKLFSAIHRYKSILQ